ncbi:uncharacterized protein LOC135117931 [Helicoverpa armigera]|uniref:uncharacterized protein LOC135117931 n=1 Tax=Helicoverpa armigera TaxID=29058 RepID=UPI000B3907B0|nr:hypothetical protein B5X24_HaOG209152 [Helicoverpa armigera]
MKLPFNMVLAPMLKPYLGRTRMFCHHPTFYMSILYTYLYGLLGLLISANHLRKHLGELPPDWTASSAQVQEGQHFMLLHDLKIIATAMGLVQYACLLAGCLTENPSLFIPHLSGQLLIVSVKILNALLLLAPVNKKAIGKLTHKVPAILLMMFNWLQEFCVFRQYLCICDL